MRYIFSIIALCFFAGCECAKEYRAYVKDKETNQPVINAKIESSHHNDPYTDSTGYFEAGYGNEGGAFGKCPNLTVAISKEGYGTYFIVDAPHTMTDTHIIYLEKE